MANLAPRQALPLLANGQIRNLDILSVERETTMSFKPKETAVRIALALGMAAATSSALAGGTITFGEDKSVSVGFGMRASYSSVEDAAADGDRSSDFSLDNARIFLSGSLNKYIKGMLNTQNSSSNNSFEVIDANVQLEALPGLTIWAGRFLSPSDRANMAGPYYSLGGGYWASIASRYGWNGGYIGRDDGVALVGSLMDDKVSYSFGAFEGHQTWRFSGVGYGGQSGADAKALKASDDLMYAGRLQVDFWDAEPGYYGTGNYLGGKDILAIGVAARTQGDGAVSSTKKGDYTSYSVDFLMEKKIEGLGAVSVEAAYYDYDTDDVYLGEQGTAYSAGAGFIFKDKVGWGQFQPFVRYQKFEADGSTSGTGVNTTGGVDTKKYDLGVAYIIDGYNAQITATYSNTEKTGVADTDAFVIATQFQF